MQNSMFLLPVVGGMQAHSEGIGYFHILEWEAVKELFYTILYIYIYITYILS